MNKDLIILNLLLGWEIIHLAKKDKTFSMRFREYPGKYSRFIRVKFSKCDCAVFLDLNDGQIEDLKISKFKNSILYTVNEENDGIIGIHILKNNDLLGIFKIISGEISFEFTTK